MGTNSTKSFSPEDRGQVRQLALDASEPITLFWPMRSMVAQNSGMKENTRLLTKRFASDVLGS